MASWKLRYTAMVTFFPDIFETLLIGEAVNSQIGRYTLPPLKKSSRTKHKSHVSFDFAPDWLRKWRASDLFMSCPLPLSQNEG